MSSPTAPLAALLFYWEPRGRQVRIEGPVERTGDEESDTYFATRPRGGQIGAHASHQSEVVAGRDELDARVRALEAEFDRPPGAPAGLVGRAAGPPPVLRVLAEPPGPAARPAPLHAGGLRAGSIDRLQP